MARPIHHFLLKGARVAPHPLLSRFLAITVVLVGALGWLGWRLLEQDRELERQRTRDVLENSADLAVAALLRSMSALNDSLAALLVRAPATTLGADLPGDAVLLVASADVVRPFPAGRLLYVPASFQLAETGSPAFRHGDSLEFRARNLPAAAEFFRAAARARDPSTRAAALLRLGRIYRKSGDTRRALSAYDEMSRLDAAIVNGAPAQLVARSARLALWRELGDTAAGRREAVGLRDALHAGRWQLRRAAFEFYDADAAGVAGVSPTDASLTDRRALSEAAEWVHDNWRSASRDVASRAGARALRIDDDSYLVAWNSREDRLAAVIGGERWLQTAVLPGVTPMLERQRVQLALADEGSRPVLGSMASAEAGARVVRSAAETGLPWNVYVMPIGRATDEAANERARLLLAGIAVAGLLALFGTYAVSRAANRELSTARLRSDFVAAVSHEFRTPLTSLRQLTEMLASDRVVSPERRREYYETMSRETARLHRFVESLLEFGRADAGVADKRSAVFDAVALVRDTVSEFEREAKNAGYVIELTAPDSALRVRGDAESLGRVLWNLLDNAVKYSPDERRVTVRLEATADRCIVSVGDRGIGIPVSEQSGIWEKFQRGSAARERGIRGTGIGLAIVRHVVTAHGGQVALESAEGEGSTFTVTLPLVRDS